MKDAFFGDRKGNFPCKHFKFQNFRKSEILVLDIHIEDTCKVFEIDRFSSLGQSPHVEFEVMIS